MRGTRLNVYETITTLRITPAHAGNTFSGEMNEIPG